MTARLSLSALVLASIAPLSPSASAQVVIQMPLPPRAETAPAVVNVTPLSPDVAVAISPSANGAATTAPILATPASTASLRSAGKLAFARYSQARRGPLYSYGPSRQWYDYRYRYGYPGYYAYGYGWGWGWGYPCGISYWNGFGVGWVGCGPCH